MNRERYLKTMRWLRSHNKLTKTLIFTEKFCEILVYVIYPVFLIYLFATQNNFLWNSVLTCGVSFVIVSIFRKVLNAKRPYEVYGVPAAIKKDKKGSSMPSRHVFSATIISVSVSFVSPFLAVACGLAAVNMAISRVILGVHFARDVLVGWLLGIVLGFIGGLIF